MRLYIIISIIIISICFISCEEQIHKQYDSSLIDHEKLDITFGKEVSNVLLDHLYVVVDSATYSHLTKDSHWKSTYAALDTGLPDFTPVVKNSSTCYLRGHQHSIEILGPDNVYNEPVGKSGIGFSLKNKDEHFHLGVEPKLRESKDSLLYATETIKMPLDGQEHTWFKAFYTPSRGTALHTWYAFYNPDFLEELSEEEHIEYSREAFLASSYADDKLFQGIKTLLLTCTPNDFKRIAQELGYLQCRLIAQDGDRYTIKSGDINIVIEPSNEIKYSRITQIICHLNNADDSVSHLGNLTITNKGKISTWDFNQLHIRNTH
ncbi:DUF5829 family protein [uncultured Dokdonia sp.]|uniref:DUF5829 family protein n=1 Tax=uncultured Dokdonia sp. TaxID=575653 RepID=UPI002609F5DF|nr:DUF5829 family protein [uncultured Dokdonia sp.]